MMYTRKTKDVFILYTDCGYGKEEIDETDTRKEAKFLKKEYTLAYKTYVWFTKKRVKI